MSANRIRRWRRVAPNPQVGTFGYADADQMHLYLNYDREHWMKEGEKPPVGLILCAGKGAAEARYALDNLPKQGARRGISDCAAE